MKSYEIMMHSTDLDQGGTLKTLKSTILVRFSVSYIRSSCSHVSLYVCIATLFRIFIKDYGYDSFPSKPRLFAAKVPGAPLIGILFGTGICWIEGFCRGPELSVLAYPFGTDGDRPTGETV